MQTKPVTPEEFLRDLEQQQPVPVYRPRPKFTRAQMLEMIRAERIIFRGKGQEWTNWRPFHCVEEARSPNRCMHWEPHFRDATCTIIATFVAYHTTKPERLCLCTGHFWAAVEASGQV
jgi:hypothetical protein